MMPKTIFNTENQPGSWLVLPTGSGPGALLGDHRSVVAGIEPAILCLLDKSHQSS